MAYNEKNKEEIFKEIISDIENGCSLRASLLKENRPAKSTFFIWVEESEIKSNQYARALDDRTELKFESIERDYLEEPQRDPETGKIDSAWVALQRLKIDSKKWELGKLKPKKYGDKIQQEHSGEVTQTIISLGNGTKPNEK